MELSLPMDSPLAQALLNSRVSADKWLVLKQRSQVPNALYESLTRLRVKEWAVHRTEDGPRLKVQLETWEQYLEHNAKLMGL